VRELADAAPVSARYRRLYDRYDVSTGWAACGAQMLVGMTQTPLRPDLAAIKTKQQQTWGSGDFSVVAARIVLVSELLADTADLRPGTRVLDVACGNGNATLAAARSGTHVVGVDYVPALLEDGRERALAEGLDVEFRLGDAEDLPVEDGSMDAVLSVFGTMFAPDHQRTAAEILRVTRPGATVGLASWTPDGFIGQLFRVIGAHVPPPAGVQSPLLWGTEPHLVDLFGDRVAEIRSQQRVCTFRHASPEDFVAFFRRWYGPTLKAFDAVGPAGERALAEDIADLVRRFDRIGDGRTVAIPATYLESVLALS
jgi:ubiquinone/menaquinone biosynthesis C-methylase UbiE